MTLDAASADLLQQAREFITGCGRSGDEPCTCPTCADATDLLDLVDAYLRRADARKEKTL